MTGKRKATPTEVRTATEAELTAADAVRAERQAARVAKAAALQAKVDAKKVSMIRQAERHKNTFGIAASASKATAVSRAIVSRARGGRKR